MRTPLRTTASLVVAALTFVLVAPPSATAATTAARPTLRVGVTHTQKSLDSWSPPPATLTARSLLTAHPGTLQNQHLMGWGVGNPEPSPGVFDWSGLDRRIALIRQTGGTPVITLCGAPDWMKGGAPGSTDMSKLDVAPTPQHFADFADLARRVAQRYPDVKTFQVWNEMKGFWDPVLLRWRYEDYTRLYNAVYDALKSVNPSIKVGGPYVSMTSTSASVASNPSTVAGPWGVVDKRNLDVVTYWLANKHGADFLTIDGSPAASGGKWLTTPTKSMDKLRAINAWIKARTALPIWWSELYAVPYTNPDGFSASKKASLWNAAITALSDSGASVVLFWQPESGDVWTGLWSRLDGPSGGKPTSVYSVVSPYLG